MSATTASSSPALWTGPGGLSAGRASPLAWIDRPGPRPAVDLARVRDPLTQAPFAPGEIVWIHGCEAAFHEASYELLLKAGGGRCGVCAQAGGWSRARVPAPAHAPAPVRAPAPTPAPSVDGASPAPLPRVTLDALRQHFGRAVYFVGRVVRVQKSWGGHVFLQFEPGDRFAGFKAVIFDRHVPLFRAAGIEFETLEGGTIGIRGLLQDHPKWGPQILVHDPACIDRRPAR